MFFWSALAHATCLSPMGMIPVDGAEVPTHLVPVVAWEPDCEGDLSWILRSVEGELAAGGTQRVRHSAAVEVAQITDLPELALGRYELALSLGDAEPWVVRFEAVSDPGPTWNTVAWTEDDGVHVSTHPGDAVVLRASDERVLGVTFADGNGDAFLATDEACVAVRAQHADGERSLPFDTCQEMGVCGVVCGTRPGGALALGWMAMVALRRRKKVSAVA